MRLRKKQLSLPVVIITLLAIGFALYSNHKQKTLTGYEDADGWVYKCSQPIKAKNGTDPTLGHPQGPVPVDESEAAHYCHKVGIE